MTGLRQGELLGLRWRDVDFKAGRSGSSALTSEASSATPKSPARHEPCRWPIASPPLHELLFQASVYQSRRTTSSSATRDRSAARARQVASGSSRPCSAPKSTRSPSMICATRLGPDARRPARQYGPSSAWMGHADSRRRRSTRITRPGRTRLSSSTGCSRPPARCCPHHPSAVVPFGSDDRQGTTSRARRAADRGRGRRDAAGPLDQRTDALTRLLDDAPLDDEPTTPEEEAAVQEGSRRPRAARRSAWRSSAPSLTPSRGERSAALAR